VALAADDLEESCSKRQTRLLCQANPSVTAD
jgi:hypothetical protein